MPVVYRASFGYLLRHPWQLALAVLGICIGVAVIVAVDLANASARKAFLMSMDAVAGAATHQIVGGPRGIDERLYVRLRVADGLRDIAPIVEDYVDIGGRAVRLLGVDVFAEENMRAFTRDIDAGVNGEGNARVLFAGLLTEPGATLMSPATAATLGISTGEQFSVVAAGREHRARLLATFADSVATGLDDLLVVDVATAQAWLDQRGYLTRIDVRLDPADAAAPSRLEALLPAGATLLSAAGRTRATADMSAAFMTNLTAMSLLALLVGLFLIYNSVSFSVLQRRGLIGVLRALGVTRRQTFTLILAEAGLIGFTGAILGAAAGVVLGDGLLALVSQSINDLYFRVSVTAVSASPFSLGKGVVAGTAAALVAAAAPALEAAGYEPRLALARSVLERRTHRLLPRLALLGVATMVVAFILIAASGRNLVAGLVAVFLLIFGVALVIPAAARVASHALAPLGMLAAGTPARMAIAGIGASLSRTGVAIVALAVAVSATIGVSIMVDSFRGSVAAWLEQTLQADLYVGVARGTLDAGLVHELTAVDGVGAYSTSRRVWLETPAGRTRILAIRMAPGSYAGTEILDADAAATWLAFEEQDAVLVSEPYAYRNRVGPGDAITLRTARGERDFTVAATFRSYDLAASAVLMSRSTYDRHWDDPAIDSIGLYLVPGASPADVAAKLEALGHGRQRILVNSNARIRELSLEIFDRTFVITDVLYWLATGVALVGILGAMLALQLERARELATLRALGMTERMLGGMITLQTGVIGLFSGLAAIPLGLVMARVLIDVINRRAFGWRIEMAVAADILLSALLFAVVAALVAGVYPAYRAARSRPALAMREE